MGTFVSVEWSMLLRKVRNKVSQGQIVSRGIDRNAGSCNTIDRKWTIDNRCDLEEVRTGRLLYYYLVWK